MAPQKQRVRFPLILYGRIILQFKVLKFQFQDYSIVD